MNEILDDALLGVRICDRTKSAVLMGILKAQSAHSGSQPQAP